MTMSMTRRVGSKAKTRESTNELYLKSEQLLRFRIAFALVSLILCVGIGTFAGDEFEFRSTAAIVGGVSMYAFVGLAFIVRRLRYSSARLRAFNMIMITLDVISLTGLVHFTRGIESDLYVLYMLPILLSSYTFGKKGIYFSALLVTVSYIGLLVSENAELLPYVFSHENDRGLAAAYSDKLWRRILARAFFFASVSLLWARFCDYMSRVARQGAERLLEQLDANERLISDSDERAKRERLINFINKAVRSTLELDKIFETAVVHLAQAVQTDLVALICPNSSSGPVVVEETREHNSGPVLSADLAQFILNYKGNYERTSDGAKVKTFLFHDPAEEPFFAPVAAELKNLGFKTLVIQPMMYGEESRGVFMLADKSQTRTYTESDVVLTKVVAGQVAVAVEHANLVSQLSRKNKDLVTKNLNLDSKNIELKTVQSQLIHQEKMASLGRLVAGIAHELNNPINFVHGNLPYLKQYVEELKKVISAIDELPAEQRKPVDDLKNKLKYDFLVSDLDNIIADLNEGAERIRHIIRDLKSFSRLDEAELKEASIQEGLESTMKILSQYYGRDKIPVEADYAEIPPVLCYPGQLNQVWMNLLSNAAQAMNTAAEAKPSNNSGSSASASTSSSASSSSSTPVLKIKTELSDQGDGSVLVSITDCGGGIKEEVRSKIFDPFFTTKAVGQGTGLGLSICHSIIERHGGQIWFDSVMGQGTTFYVRLPLQAITKQLAAMSEPD
jgi:signal transduction histidine kinase